MASEFRINIVIDPSSADRGVRVVERRLNQLSGQADALRNILGKALTGLGLAFSIRELVTLADTFTNIENKLATVTDGTGDLANKTDELFAVANRTRTSFAATAELYSRVARSAKVLGRTEEEVTKFTETLSKSLIVSGASAQEARAGLIQLSQGIASGVLRGDELRSVLEQLPYTADIIAKQLGVTRGELREFGEAGKLSADLILDAFKNAAGEVDAAFAKTTPTVEQSFTILRNNLIKFIGDTNKTNGLTERLSQTIIKLSENIEIVARSVVALSVVLGVNYFIAVVQQATTAMIRFGVALLANPITAIPALIAAGIAALVAFGDQIKVSEDGLSTLQDVAMVLLPKLISWLQELVSGAVQFASAFVSNALPSIEYTLVFIGSFIDSVRAYFAGLGAYFGAFWDEWTTAPGVQLYKLAKVIGNAIITMISTMLAILAAAGLGIKKFLGGLLDAATYTVEAILRLASGNLDKAKEAAGKAKDAFVGIGENLTVGLVNDFADQFTSSKAIMGTAFEKTMQAAFPEMEKAAMESGKNLSTAFQDAYNESLTLNDSVTGIQQQFGSARAAIEAVLQEAEARAKLRKQQEDQLKLERELAAQKEKSAQQSQTATQKLTQSQKDLLKEILGPQQELQQKLLDIEVLRQQGLISTSQYKEAVRALNEELMKSDAAYQRQLDLLNEIKGPQEETRQKYEDLLFLLNSQKISAEEYTTALDKLTINALESSTTMEAGFQRAFAKIRLEAQDFASVAENSFNVLADVGTDALTKLVTEGNVNFKDLARNAIAQLAQIISRLLMMQLLSSSLGFLGFTPGSGAAAAGISGAMASGGTTQPGRSYLVGERGPELFTPGQTGVVSPNPGSMASAPPQVNVQVVNVNDPNEVPSALNSGRADQAILNVLRRNRQSVQRITG